MIGRNYKMTRKKCLVFTHQSDESGAPRSLLNILEELQARKVDRPEIYTIVLRPGIYSEKFEELSNDSMVLPKNIALGISGRLYSLLLVVRFIRRCGPFDFSLINSSVNLRAMLLCKLLGIPFFIYVRESRKMIDNFLGIFRRYLFRFSSGIICVSEDTREWVLDFSRKVPVHTIRNGISFERVKSVTAVKDPKVLRLCYVGFLDKRKGIDYFCELVSKVLSNNLNCEFLVVGEVKDNECFEVLKQYQEGTGRVTFTGVVDDALAHIAKCDGLLMLSREEALPRVVLEASALGVPTIGFDVNGTRELLPPDYDMLSSIGDVSSVYDAIINTSKEELEIKGSQIRKYCLDNFDRQMLVSTLYDVLESSNEK